MWVLATQICPNWRRIVLYVAQKSRPFSAHQLADEVRGEETVGTQAPPHDLEELARRQVERHAGGVERVEDDQVVGRAGPRQEDAAILDDGPHALGFPVKEVLPRDVTNDRVDLDRVDLGLGPDPRERPGKGAAPEADHADAADAGPEREGREERLVVSHEGPVRVLEVYGALSQRIEAQPARRVELRDDQVVIRSVPAQEHRLSADGRRGDAPEGGRRQCRPGDYGRDHAGPVSHQDRGAGEERGRESDDQRSDRKRRNEKKCRRERSRDRACGRKRGVSTRDRPGGLHFPDSDAHGEGRDHRDRQGGRQEEDDRRGERGPAHVPPELLDRVEDPFRRDDAREHQHRRERQDDRHRGERGSPVCEPPSERVAGRQGDQKGRDQAAPDVNGRPEAGGEHPGSQDFESHEHRPGHEDDDLQHRDLARRGGGRVHAAF